MMRHILILMLCLPFAAAAQTKADPGKVMDQAVAVIMGYGQDGAINAAGLAHYVGLERAGARASVVRSLMAMDLDGDGVVTREEAGFATAAVAGRSRGRLWSTVLAADADGDGRITAAETATYAEKAALGAFSEAKAQSLLALMEFDVDGDGWVTLAEVAAGLEYLPDADG